MDKIITFNCDYILRDIAGIYFAVNICDKNLYRHKKIFSFNKTGFFILSTLKNHKTIAFDNLLNELLIAFNGNVDKTKLTADLSIFLKDVCQKGIVLTNDN